MKTADLTIKILTTLNAQPAAHGPWKENVNSDAI